MQVDVQARRARWAVAAMFLANGFVMGAWAPQIPLLMPRHDVTRIGAGPVDPGPGSWGGFGDAVRRAADQPLRRAAGVVAVFIGVDPGAADGGLFAQPLALALFMAVFGAMAGCMDVAMNAQAVVIERRLDRAIMSSSPRVLEPGRFYRRVGRGLGHRALGVIWRFTLLAHARRRGLRQTPVGSHAYGELSTPEWSGPGIRVELRRCQPARACLGYNLYLQYG